MVHADLFTDRIQGSFLMKMLINASPTLTWLEVSVNEQFALYCCIPLLVIFHTLKWRSFGIPPLMKVVNIQKGPAPTVLFSSPIMHRISCMLNEKNPNFHSTYCSWNGPSQELPLASSNNRWTDFTEVMDFGVSEVMKQNYFWLGFVGVSLWKVKKQQQWHIWLSSDKLSSEVHGECPFPRTSEIAIFLCVGETK